MSASGRKAMMNGKELNSIRRSARVLPDWPLDRRHLRSRGMLHRRLAQNRRLEGPEEREIEPPACLSALPFAAGRKAELCEMIAHHRVLGARPIGADECARAEA